MALLMGDPTQGHAATTSLPLSASLARSVTLRAAPKNHKPKSNKKGEEK